MKQKTLEFQLPRSHFNEDYQVIPYSDEMFKTICSDWERYFYTPLGRKLKNDLRGKIFNFVETNGYIAEGRTNVNPLGVYTIGTPPRLNTDERGKASVIVGEQLYAQACVDAYNQCAQDMGFVHKDDDNYLTRRDAMMAVEGDSISGKGPYDNATHDTALKTVVTVLKNHMLSDAIDPKYFPVLQDALLRRFYEYKRYVNRGYAISSSDYVNHMLTQGLKSTMRGFPFYAAGNSLMKDYWFDATKFMFRNTTVPISNIKWEKVVDDKHEDGSAYKRNLTVDEFIQTVHELIDSLGLSVTDWFTLDHVFIIPISRNQGSPFKTKWSHGKLVLTGERKDMKYRLVTPIGAFVQARSILAVDNLVRNAKRTVGRAGLMDPDTNEQRLNKFIQNAQVHLKVLISTDFDAYDSTLPSQMMAGECNMYMNLFDNTWIKDGIVCAALSLCHKILMLPCYNTDIEMPYSHYTRYFMRTIKGIKSFSNRKIKDQALFKNSTTDDIVKERFDFSVWCFYIWKGYLPSGHICTNMVGSDCTLAMGRHLIPVAMGDEPGEAVASGDDCVQEVSKTLYDQNGLTGTYKLLEKYYMQVCNMIVKEQKQIKVCYKGLPLVDFLQHPYIQGEDSVDHQPTRNKWFRQDPANHVCERRSRLYPTIQWIIVLGKGEAGTCAENCEMVAKSIIYQGESLYKMAHKKHYRPRVHPGLKNSKDPLVYNEAYTIYNSHFGGYEQLLGLVKTYGQDLVSAIGKYAAGKTADIIADFESELETKAPHREGMAKAFFKSLGEEAYEKAGGDERFGEVPAQTHYYFIEALQKVLESRGDDVASVKLDQPQIRAEAQQLLGVAEPTEEDAEGYEFDEGTSD